MNNAEKDIIKIKKREFICNRFMIDIIQGDLGIQNYSVKEMIL